jgi:cellulose synthase/poly-beta-1,6-N-acetylglucosamine synthase-like glycosyltransferase
MWKNIFETVGKALLIYTVLKIFYSKWKSYRKKRKPRKVTGNPREIRFAVAIPAHNEGPGIAKNVRSILEAGKKEWVDINEDGVKIQKKVDLGEGDVKILCNGCTDNTAEEVRKCGVEPVIVPVKGKEETLTYAIDELKLFPEEKYSDVCFFDGDTRVDPEYFRKIKKKLEQNPDADLVCGRPRSLPCNWLTAHRAVQYWAFHAIHKSAQEKIRAILVVPGCAGAYSTKALKKIVWSPDTRIGDMDATIQAALLGMKIVFEPKAIVYTQDPNNIRDYTTQLFRRWNRGLWMNMRKHGILWKRFGKPYSALHWDCRIMFFEQFFPFIYLFVVWKFHLQYFFWSGIVFYFAMVLFETLCCAFYENRWDILKYFPIFPFMRIYDLLLFVGSAYCIFIKKEKSGIWESPKRY